MTHVLIVDDEPMLIEELQESLEFEDFTVSSAESVASALQQCDQNSFDVVVTDLKMPTAGGLELIRELKARDYPAILFVVSGHGAESNRERAHELGAEACFAKPLDVDNLIEAINQNLSMN